MRFPTNPWRFGGTGKAGAFGDRTHTKCRWPAPESRFLTGDRHPWVRRRSSVHAMRSLGNLSRPGGGYPRAPVPENAGMAPAKCGLFGEMLQQESVWNLNQEFALGFDLVLSIQYHECFPVYPGPIFRALEWGALSVEVNPSETEVSAHVHERFEAPARNGSRTSWPEARPSL